MSQKNDFASEMGRCFDEFNAALYDQNFERASAAMNSIWIQFQIFSVSQTTDLEELTYIKAPVKFDRGGSYILSLMHVDGPKIKLKGESGDASVTSLEEKK